MSADQQPSVDGDTWPLRELSVARVLARQAAARPDKVFLTETATGRRFSYRQMDEWSNRVAHALEAFGIARGAHTGVLMGNSAEHLALFFGAAKLGAVLVPVNTAARGELLRYYLGQSDSESVVVDAGLLDRLGEVLAQLPLVRRVLVVRAAATDAKPAAQLPAQVALADFHELLEAARDTRRGMDIACSALLMLAYTSGTTGPSKGSMLSHAAALSYGTGAARAQGYRASDIFYVCLPLFHNNALLAAMGSALVCGGSVVLSPRFSVSRFWQEIRDSGATVTNFLGAMSAFLWGRPPAPDDAEHSLRLVSMAPTPQYAAEFERRFGLRVMNNYGLSDFGMGTSFTEHDPRGKLGSIGRPRHGMRVRIVDADDFELPDGEPGEIVLQSEEPWRAATGYYKMAEATLAAHRNQWFHTGDRGLRDAEGYFWFIDRQKDCIRRRGENISAFEVEQIIASHADVANAAVFPVATASHDEEVAAVVVLREGAVLDERALVRHCSRNMAYFMIPRYLQFRDALPATASQKVEKFRLRREFETSLDGVWDREREGVVLDR